jgi:hypothetical protein
MEVICTTVAGFPFVQVHLHEGEEQKVKLLPLNFDMKFLEKMVTTQAG